MKFVKPAAVIAAALLAVQYLPGFVRETKIANAQDAEIIDAVITGYEGNADDPETFKVITADSQPVATAVASAANLVHDSKFDDYVKVDGIDVSFYNGEIDWNTVKASGIDYAIIRIGYRGYAGGICATDSKYYQNIRNANAAGVKVGAYFFTQALTVQEAIEEAKYCIERVKDYKISMPIYFDVEKTEGDGVNGRLNRANLSISQRTAIAEAFCQTLQDAGYQSGIYSSKSYFLEYLDPDYLATKYGIWLAHYTNQTTYKGDYEMWQYTSSGYVNGISGKTDMNIYYSRKAHFAEDTVTISETGVPVQPAYTGGGILSFSSSDPSVATVDESGNITGVSGGTTVVTVSSDNGSCDTITVTVDQPFTSMLKYTGAVFSQVGETQKLGRGDVQITSTDDSVVSVSEDGTVTANGRGTAVLTADDGQGNRAVCNVLVTDSGLVPGDCNLDGNVNAIDAVFILNLAASLGTGDVSGDFSDAYRKVYDFNSDGNIDSFDANDVLVTSALAGVGYTN